MLLRNQVITHVESGQNARVLFVDSLNDTVCLFNLSEEKAIPHSYSLTSINKAILEGFFTEFESKDPVRPKDISPNAMRRRDQAYSYIEPLICNTNIYDESARGPLMKARATELKCSEQTLFRYLRLWWRGGQTKQSLVPGFNRIGGKKGCTYGRGRPPIYQQGAIYQVSDIDHNWMQEAIKKYLADKTCTVDGAYQSLLEKHYSYVDGEGQLWLKTHGECPSIHQFRRYLNQEVPMEMRIRLRHGDAEFELNHRAKLGSLRASTYTVGQYYEIDATIVDVILVHQHNRSKIIGKPTLYTVIDRKSNLIVGFYLGLEPACWLAAMHAIKSIAEDKEALCQRYDLPYIPSDWPAHCCFPQEFIADRGSEMLSEASTQIAEGLEINVRNLPARRADWKPHVECGFKQLQRSLANGTPGYIPPEDFGKRQKHDRSKDSALTLYELTRLILARVISQNKISLANNPMRPEHILQGIQPTPINIWNIEVGERAGLITRYSEAQVHFALLPQTEASISREGIRVGDCYYDAPEAHKYGWFVQSGVRSFKKTVSYDRRLVDSIYVHDEKNPNGYFIATLSERCNKYSGLSAAEVEALVFNEKSLVPAAKAEKRQFEADFHVMARPMNENASALAKAATKGKARSSRKKDIVAARSDARKQERQEIAPLDAPLTAVSADSVPIAANDSRANLPKSNKKTYRDILDGK